MGLKRWFYRGGRPNRVARLLDRCTSALYGLGIAPEYLVALEVPGRRSGRPAHAQASSSSWRGRTSIGAAMIAAVFEAQPIAESRSSASTM